MQMISLAFMAFLIATGVALLFTPLVIRWASRQGIFDHPSSRRVHVKSIPRAGGVALLVAFLAAYSISIAFAEDGGSSLFLQKEQLCFFLGALLIFGVGLWDDIKGLSPWIKLIAQIFVALLVGIGGNNVELLSVGLYEGVFLSSGISLFITVFWIVLLINAINLIDGLDGLAAGVCLFVSFTLLVLCFSSDNLTVILGFSALAGACLGFLRYNFNPATVFMGDCGSYLLGYLLAVLTIQGAMKSHATVALLIPIIALGVPLLDTLLAPVRRFVLGKKMFLADQSHIHHLLLKLGYSQRKVVVIIYGVTVALGVVALAFVFVKDQLSAYVLVIPGVMVFLGVRKLGYLEYIAADKVLGWLRDITDEAGLSNERRSFLNLQMQIMKSGNMEELWHNVTLAIEKLDFDLAELHFDKENAQLFGSGGNVMTWQRVRSEKEFDFNEHCQFKLEMPLMQDQDTNYGILWLIKDLKRSNMSHYTLRRVEHLRRTTIGVLNRFAGK